MTFFLTRLLSVLNKFYNNKKNHFKKFIKHTIKFLNTENNKWLIITAVCSSILYLISYNHHKDDLSKFFALLTASSIFVFFDNIITNKHYKYFYDKVLTWVIIPVTISLIIRYNFPNKCDVPQNFFDTVLCFLHSIKINENCQIFVLIAPFFIVVVLGVFPIYFDVKKKRYGQTFLHVFSILLSISVLIIIFTLLILNINDTINSENLDVIAFYYSLTVLISKGFVIAKNVIKEKINEISSLPIDVRRQKIQKKSKYYYKS